MIDMRDVLRPRTAICYFADRSNWLRYATLTDVLRSDGPAGRSSSPRRGLAVPSSARAVNSAAGAPLVLAALPRVGANIAGSTGAHRPRTPGSHCICWICGRLSRAPPFSPPTARFAMTGRAKRLSPSTKRRSTTCCSRRSQPIAASSIPTRCSAAGCCPSRPAAAPRIAATAASRRTTRRASAPAS